MREIWEKIWPYLAAVAALGLGVVTFIFFDMEGILWAQREQQTVSRDEIENGEWANHTGKTAGEGILSLTTQSEWDSLVVEYVTVVPRSIYKTNIYSLADWADRSLTNRTGAYRGSKDSHIKRSIDYFIGYMPRFFTEYYPYYVIELEDGSHILAQMNRSIANKIARGKEIALPIGQKERVSSQYVKDALLTLSRDMGFSTDYMLYVIDDQWQEANSLWIFWGKFAAAFAVFALVVSAETIVKKVRGRKNR
ncbi:MAG: hypothetical protein HDR26_01210 [Lachnospiraceae bacterium]|nr:hypothetical protein [Lachnospiraceae bacterium]